MSSLTLLIIRHGEKPPKKPQDADYGAGVDAKGAPDVKSLAVRGWQRAGAWTALFGFDALLRLDRAQSGAPWQFRQLLPQLLAGDSNQPLGLGGGAQDSD